MQRMTTEGVPPTLQTYSAAISACEKGEQARPALGLLERMKNAKIEPDIIVYSAAICACGKTGLWEPAVKLFNEMQVQSTFGGEYLWRRVEECVHAACACVRAGGQCKRVCMHVLYT